MHILLTDILTCPRCGPEFGLIVLAEELEDRRVLRGRLGCANCREEYTIEGGVADLRYGATSAPIPAAATAGDDQAFRVAALLGIGNASGTVFLAGGAGGLAAEVARLLPHAQVVASGEPPAEGATGVSWLLLGGRLPFRTGSLRGAALVGSHPADLLGEVTRVLAPGTRVVLDPAPPNAREQLARRGFEILLDQDGVVVASAPTSR